MQNQGVTIHLDSNNKIDLKEILNVIGSDGKESLWMCSDVESLGESAEILHEFSDDGNKISGSKFYEIISGIYQVIDGNFDAYKYNENVYWLRIRLIRGDEFDIETNNNELLNKIRNSFHNVKDLVY